jgi:predicted transposase YdaD
MSQQPHDALVKAVFGDPVEAAGLFRAALPAAIAARVDWATLKRDPGSHVDPDLRQRHGDLVFTARLHDGGAVLPYLLLEHQSTPDPWMPLRLLVRAARDRSVAACAPAGAASAGGAARGAVPRAPAVAGTSS